MSETSSKLKLIFANENHSVWLSIGLHLLPGILATLVFIPLARYFWTVNLPIILALHSVLLLILIPFQIGIIFFVRKEKPNTSNEKSLFSTFSSSLMNKTKNKTKIVILLSMLVLFWAILIMGVVDKQLGISDWIFLNWFNWLPEYFDMTGVYTNPEEYSTGILIVVLLASLFLGAIIGPISEEFYFRGILLPRLMHNKWYSPIFGAVFFACYHLWTPWMIPMRIVALMPLILLVWWKKDMKIGIYSHILLNLLGDVILVIPVFFL